jgi:hypothetical protein
MFIVVLLRRALAVAKVKMEESLVAVLCLAVLIGRRRSALPGVAQVQKCELSLLPVLFAVGAP